MVAREAVIEEIQEAPGPVVQEIYDFMRYLKRKEANADRQGENRVIPDFKARKRELFGDRILADSQEILDEMRADRF